MGGNALSTATKRLSNAEYYLLCEHLRATFPKVGSVQYKFFVVPSYKNKESHGDVDVLVSDNLDTNQVETYLKNVFTVTEKTTNGNQCSFGVLFMDNVVQVDFTFVEDELFESTLNYYSFNDLGNWLGKLARSVGLKLGTSGLQYEYFHENNKLGTYTLTKDWHEVCRLLDVEPYNFQSTFNDLEDMFKLVTNSKYFTSEAFELKNLPSNKRARDSKRNNYMLFLEWMEKNCTKVYNDKKFNCDLFWKTNKEHFAGLNKWQTEKLNTHMQKEELKKKFNGNLVYELTGLCGSTLGEFMSEFKRVYSPKVLLGMNQDEVAASVLAMYKDKL